MYIKHALSISPALTSSLISLGLRPSTWHPTLKAVPRISRTVPFSSLAKERLRMTRAISMISSRGIDLVCLMFFSFLRSRGGSLRALMTREEAEGTTETWACRFWMVSLTVTRRPFCLWGISNWELGLVSKFSFVQTYPVTSGLGDIFTDLLGWETERTNLRGKGRLGADLTTCGPQVAVNCVRRIRIQWQRKCIVAGWLMIQRLARRWENLHDLDLSGVELGSCSQRGKISRRSPCHYMTAKGTILTHGECER